MSNDVGVFPVSFIYHGFDVDERLEVLWPLSASHGSLLSIFACTQCPTTLGPLLVVEEVSSYHDYCEEIATTFLQRPDHSKKAWWPFIADRWRSIFRDCVVALTFLCMDNYRSCGNLLNNFYVTKEGRGRILPGRSVIARKQGDIDDFISLMKQLLLCPFNSSTLLEDVELNFPAQVLHFFSFAPSNKALPLEYLLNHPSVWSFPELIDYPRKFKKITYMRSLNKDKSLCGTVLNQTLVTLMKFDTWDVKLSGVYTAIWKMGDPGKGKITKEVRRNLVSLGAVKISSYGTAVSLGRYFAAAIEHYNDPHYSDIRGPEELTHAEVVQDLLSMFPDFYTVMYEAVGTCFLSGEIGRNILDELGTIDEKADSFPALASNL